MKNDILNDYSSKGMTIVEMEMEMEKKKKKKREKRVQKKHYEQNFLARKIPLLFFLK